MFTSDTRFCVLDYETYSEADLKKVGASEYARHTSTEILCLAFRAGTREGLKTAPTLSWSPFRPSPALDLFKEILHDPTVVLIAHNAYFEQVITRHVLGIHYVPPIERWYCTSAVAASLALPRKLEGAAKVLSLPVEKDMGGHRLMLKWSKPRTPSKHNPSTRHTDSDELDRLIAYCKTDVDTEVELFLKTPVMSKRERAVWLLDQKINHRGVLVDRHLVAKALELIEIETKNLSERLSQATDGKIKSPKRVAALLDFLNTNGCYLENLQAKTVADTLKSDMPTGIAREVLEIRQAASKSSTAKYQAFQRQSTSDGRLRGSLVYHSASTGRWSSSGVQLQNLPRQTIKGIDSAAEYIREGDLDFIRLLYGSPMEVFSNCLRSVLVAPEGKVLDVADYAGIEARVLFWLAKHENGLKAFREGRDLYRELAATIFNTSLEKVQQNQRFVGKQGILGAGFGMGHEKFMHTCASQGQSISEGLAQTAIRAYRKVHYPVVKLWKSFEIAALMAIKNPNKTYTINYTRWWLNRGFLWCELPSGRRLAYFKPEIKYLPNRFTKEVGPVIHHHGINPRTKQWTEQATRGPILVHNCVQAISRDLMAEAMLRIERAGPWEIVLSVHDELIAERDPLFGGSNEEFCDLMSELPDWAEGLPIRCEGFETVRYRK